MDPAPPGQCSEVCCDFLLTGLVPVLDSEGPDRVTFTSDDLEFAGVLGNRGDEVAVWSRCGSRRVRLRSSSWWLHGLEVVDWTRGAADWDGGRREEAVRYLILV